MGKNELLKKLSAAQFAAWELHVYLDTHPDDKQAIQLYKKYDKKTRELKDEYEKHYGALTIDGGDSGDEWLQNPWPWELQGGDN
jgi:spore coat protein JB